MSVTDPARAQDIINSFIVNINKYRSYNTPIMGRVWNDNNVIEREKLQQLKKQRYHAELPILRLQPLIVDLGRRIAPQIDSRQFEKGILSRAWIDARMASEQLLGILDNEQLRSQILGPTGPLLSAQRLHPWVWDAAVNLWEDGYYKEATIGAVNAIELHTQLKIKRSDLSGKKLYSQLFTCKDGDGRPLSFSQFEPGTEDWTSAHQGAHHYGMGCSQRIRNLMVHSTDDIAEQEGLEYLASLSVLARWIDKAQVRTN